jgi:hypothetical protein
MTELVFENKKFKIENVNASRINFEEKQHVPQGSVEKNSDGSVFAFVEFVSGTADDVKKSVMQFCENQGKMLKRPPSSSETKK